MTDNPTAFAAAVNIATTVNVDPEFQKALEDDPRKAFASMDIPVPEDVTLQVHVDSDETVHVVFPPDPNRVLSDEMLNPVSGGACLCVGTNPSNLLRGDETMEDLYGLPMQVVYQRMMGQA